MTEAATRYGQSNNVTALYPVVAVDALATAAEDFHPPLNLEIVFKTEWSAHPESPDAKTDSTVSI